MLFSLVLYFVLGFIIGVLAYLLYHERKHPKVTFEEYLDMYGDVQYVSKPVFKQLLDNLMVFNRENVRYLIVDELPAIEDVEDRRSVYVVVTECSREIWMYTMYTPVAGVWYAVEDHCNMSDYLGKVE